MTIDEAIQRYKNNVEYERTHGNLQGCLEFRQLAKWLEELMAYRNMYHADNVDNCLREKAQEEGMTVDDSERYLRLMLGGMEYAVIYWKDRDKEESDIEQTNVEAVKTALDIMRKYQKITKILNSASYTENGTVYSYTYDEDTRVRHIREVIKDEKEDG